MADDAKKKIKDVNDDQDDSKSNQAPDQMV